MTDCIELHITPDQLSILRTAEESERDFITQFADQAADREDYPEDYR